METDRVAWLSDLIRLEIVLWERVDARLKAEHGVSLAYFEVLHALRDEALRVGDMAQRLRITVGGASKLVDRVEAAGLIRRAADPGDRRASRVTLTAEGRVTLGATTGTYAAALGDAIDPVLTADDQRLLHDTVRRLLAAVAP